MKLWLVDVSFEMIVYADTEAKALRVAELNAREEAENAACWAQPLKRPYDSEWKDSCPYGLPRGDYRTVEAILAEIEARPPTTEEIEAAGQQRLIA